MDGQAKDATAAGSPTYTDIGRLSPRSRLQHGAPLTSAKPTHLGTSSWKSQSTLPPEQLSDASQSQVESGPAMLAHPSQPPVMAGLRALSMDDGKDLPYRLATLIRERLR